MFSGLFGFSVLSLLLLVMAHIDTHSQFWGHSPRPPYHLEDPIDGLIQLTNNAALLSAFLGIIVSICIFQVVGISVTQEMSATTRMILDSMRTIFIWIISLSLQWQSFHFLQPLGFLCIIIGMCLYYDLLIMPICKKMRTKCRRKEKMTESDDKSDEKKEKQVEENDQGELEKKV